VRRGAIISAGFTLYIAALGISILGGVVSNNMTVPFVVALFGGIAFVLFSSLTWNWENFG
jgi:hypothetical protein